MTETELSISHGKFGHKSLIKKSAIFSLMNLCFTSTESSSHFFLFPLLYIVINEIELLFSPGLWICSANFKATSASTLHSSEEANS